MRYAKITDRLQGLGSDKWAVHIEGKRRQASGQDMIMLSIGEPDFHPPASLVGMIDERIRAGRTRYSNGRGEPEVLQAIAAYYTRRSGHKVAPDQVTFLPGTQTALFAAMMTIAEEGSDILMPDPYYATYEGIIAASGAKFVPIRTLPEDGLTIRRVPCSRRPRSPRSARFAASMICGSCATRSMPI
jgi:arginine:pyruvate transaminase